MDSGPLFIFLHKINDDSASVACVLLIFSGARYISCPHSSDAIKHFLLFFSIFDYYHIPELYSPIGASDHSSVLWTPKCTNRTSNASYSREAVVNQRIWTVDPKP